jgi:hypothetical protein
LLEVHAEAGGSVNKMAGKNHRFFGGLWILRQAIRGEKK